MTRRSTTNDKRLRRELEPARIIPIVTATSIPGDRTIHVTFQRLSASGLCIQLQDEFLNLDEAKSLLNQLSSAIGLTDTIPADY